MLKQQLSQKMLQKLSPQQIQLMKLLQIPTAALDARIKEELEGNPALEDGKETDAVEEKKAEKEKEEPKETTEEVDLSDYLSDDDISLAADYRESTYSSYYDEDDEPKSMPLVTSKTFHEYLHDQLGLLKLDDRRHKISEQIVGSIGSDGYLRREPQAMVNDLAFSQNIETTVEEIEDVLKLVQSFEPAGVAACDLQECLALQLKRELKDETGEGESGSEQLEAIHLALRIIHDHFDAFAKKHYEKLESRLGVDREALREAVNEILKLNPKPASAYSGGGSRINQYIIPDFIILNDDGVLKLTLNSRNAPDLRINEGFMNMMKEYKQSPKKDKQKKEAVMFIKQKLDSAKWFIEAIKQRQHTLLSTMNTIMKYQEAFFLTGDEMMLRPMILKDIADVTGLDISTVSRVANSKYVQTEFGTFPLKYFFSESLQTQDGEEASTREVKRVLQNIIEEEDKRKPYSDQKLMEMLKEEGYEIARRTVAKYREQLNIPVARLRREI